MVVVGGSWDFFIFEFHHLILFCFPVLSLQFQVFLWDRATWPAHDHASSPEVVKEKRPLSSLQQVCLHCSGSSEIHLPGLQKSFGRTIWSLHKCLWMENEGGGDSGPPGQQAGGSVASAAHRRSSGREPEEAPSGAKRPGWASGPARTWGISRGVVRRVFPAPAANPWSRCSGERRAAAAASSSYLTGAPPPSGLYKAPGTSACPASERFPEPTARLRRGQKALAPPPKRRSKAAAAPRIMEGSPAPASALVATDSLRRPRPVCRLPLLLSGRRPLLTSRTT